MRAMGPGSVSSFLKIILDVVYYGLLVVLTLSVALDIAALLFSFNPEFLRTLDAELGGVATRGPILVAGLVAFSLYVAALLAIIGQLRQIFATLTAGDPFHPTNIRRLQFSGVVLAAMEVGRYLFDGLMRTLAPEAGKSGDGVNLTAWFAVLVVFVLAEVFREGARLRREAELTI